MQISIRISDASPNQEVYRVRKWGDPVLVDLLGADVNLVGVDNFQVVKTATIGGDGKPYFNDISRTQTVDYAYLESLQIDDEYTVEKKMNWLINRDGIGRRPYWMNGTSNLYFGPLVFGGQLVKLGEEMSAWGQYPNRSKEEWIRFRRLIGIRRADFGKYTYDNSPHFVQRCTEAIGTDNKYNEFVRGEVFHPVWSDLDFPANYGDGKLWLAVEFLEMV